MEATSTPGSSRLDALGRPRSPATLPEFRKGRAPGNKGLKLPAEVLSQEEINGLMDSFSRVSPTGKRNRAMVWAMYRLGLRVSEALALATRHYQRGSDRLTIPATQRWPERPVEVDVVSREVLDEWLAARRSLGVRPVAPVFCAIAEPGRGRPIRSAYVRTMLARQAEQVGIEKRVTPEGLRRSGDEHRAIRAGRVEGPIAAYIEDAAFRTRYPDAYAKWKVAHDLYAADAKEHASRIGHDCREAMMAFASTLAAEHGMEVEAPASHTLDRIRPVLRESAAGMGRRVVAFEEALVRYWGTVSDLANRQEHDSSRETPLDVEDARRLVFQTMLVMYEVDLAIQHAMKVRSG